MQKRCRSGFPKKSNSYNFEVVFPWNVFELCGWDCNFQQKLIFAREGHFGANFYQCAVPMVALVILIPRPCLASSMRVFPCCASCMVLLPRVILPILGSRPPRPKPKILAEHLAHVSMVCLVVLLPRIIPPILGSRPPRPKPRILTWQAWCTYMCTHILISLEDGDEVVSLVLLFRVILPILAPRPPWLQPRIGTCLHFVHGRWSRVAVFNTLNKPRGTPIQGHHTSNSCTSASLDKTQDPRRTCAHV